MTLIRPDDGADWLDEERRELQALLREARSDIAELLRRGADGAPVAKGAAGEARANLKFWLRYAMELEKEIRENERKTAGVSGDWGLDLDAARAEIRCRLARIQRCCDAGRLPG